MAPIQHKLPTALVIFDPLEFLELLQRKVLFIFIFDQQRKVLITLSCIIYLSGLGLRHILNNLTVIINIYEVTKSNYSLIIVKI